MLRRSATVGAVSKRVEVTSRLAGKIVDPLTDAPFPARQARPPEPRHRLGAAISWLLVAASVASPAAARPLQERLAKRVAERSTTQPAGEPDPPSFQLRLAGRYAVG